MADPLPTIGSTVIRRHFGGALDGTDIEYLVLATRMDPTENVLSIKVSLDSGDGWVLWQPEDGQWRLA